MYSYYRSVSVFLKRVFLLLVNFCLVCQSVFCEAVTDKKAYDSKLDSLWSRNLFISSLSRDGKWVVLSEMYDIKENIFHLIRTGDVPCHIVSSGGFLCFSPDNNWFGAISPDNKLEMYNLKDGYRREWNGISSYCFSPAGDHFAAESIEKGKRHSLRVVNLNDTTIFEMEGVFEYEWHPVNSILAANLSDSSGSQVVLYNSETDRCKVLTNSSTSKYSRLQWAYSGNTIVYLEQSGGRYLLHHYNLSDSILTTITPEMYNPYPDSLVMIRTLSVSDDGATVIFSCSNKTDYRKQEPMEIWDTDEPWIYPRLKKLYGFQRPLCLIGWDVRSGKMFRITDENTPDALFNPNFWNVLVYDRLIYEPEYKQDTDVDLYLKNFQTGQKVPVTCKQYMYPGFVKLSPTGRYTAFFKENNWRVFDSESQKVVCLTKGMGLHFEQIDDSPKNDKEPYGNPGWTENEEFIILYDRYDIWLMKPDGSIRLRITQGREKQIQYRISLNLSRYDKDYKRSLYFPSTPVFKIKSGIILEMTGDDFKTGYAILKGKSYLETLVYGPGKVEDILMSSDWHTIVFKRSRYNEPPAIYALDMVSKEITLVYQSNEKLQDFDLGRDVLIGTRSGEKASFSGALLYPSEYDPAKKYPMIVFIYEKNCGFVNSFLPPSDYGYFGFNLLRYITNGYFVLLPDIEYTIGEPGISALKSVNKLVRKALEEESIDRNRIGLIGHSFGGYEAAFIATQTDIFRAVVAGSAITDLVSWYHDIQGNGWDTEQMWRMENQQLRMGASYYDLKKLYQKNSPLHNVERLNTPLLLWAGKNDYNVNWDQSIYMFMAMKRLGKTGKLLLFNDDGHSMMKPDNKKRLSEEILSWFNFYLKEGGSE
jgi:dipeptidyl aminopeptidase/acylaminoacyl peptidase